MSSIEISFSDMSNRRLQEVSKKNAHLDSHFLINGLLLDSLSSSFFSFLLCNRITIFETFFLSFAAHLLNLTLKIQQINYFHFRLLCHQISCISYIMYLHGHKTRLLVNRNKNYLSFVWGSRSCFNQNSLVG